MANGKDYYEILGVPTDADADQIKQAYRTLARKYHPDKNPGDKQAESRFKELGQAHAVLADPEQRKRYDAIRSGAFRVGPDGPGGGAGVNFEDLFGGQSDGGFSFGGMGDILSSLFGQGGGGPRTRRGRGRGEDIHHVLEIPFELAVKGGTTHLGIPRPQPCPACMGSGAASPKDRHTCPDCGGSGHTAQSQGAFAINRPCTRCLGRGAIIDRPCATCGGRGQQQVKRRLSIEIPAGIEPGSTLRVSGEGRPDPQGGPPGDLLIEIAVSSDEELHREGLDIVSTVALRYSQLVRGATIDVRTLRGTVALKVPPLTPPGARLRLAGQGITAGDRTGDHLVEVALAMPSQLGPKQKELIDALSASGL